LLLTIVHASCMSFLVHLTNLADLTASYGSWTLRFGPKLKTFLFARF